jgi:hypothetical protein
MAEVDERYKRGIIYTIRNITDDTIIYVGSTIQSLTIRFNKHKCDCKSGKTCSLYNNIENNDWTLWYIELYENYPCNSKKELERREGQVIREIGTINKNIAGRTDAEYYKKNIDKIKEQKKKYRKENAEKIKEANKIYREENAERAKEYYKKNIDKIKEQKKEYRKENAEKIKKKICCSICGAFSTKNHLPRHQKSKKCMSSRTK